MAGVRSSSSRRIGVGLSPPCPGPPTFLPLIPSPFEDKAVAASNDPDVIRGDVPKILDREIGIPLGTFPPLAPAIRGYDSEGRIPLIVCGADILE